MFPFSTTVFILKKGQCGSSLQQLDRNREEEGKECRCEEWKKKIQHHSFSSYSGICTSRRALKSIPSRGTDLCVCACNSIDLLFPIYFNYQHNSVSQFLPYLYFHFSKNILEIHFSKPSKTNCTSKRKQCTFRNTRQTVASN